MKLAPYIDHTILKQTTTLAEIGQLCQEAVQHGFAAVCVPPPFVKRVKVILAPSDVKVATVVGFPFGYSATEAKVAETILAMVDGADEIDVVINLIALRMNDWEYLAREIKLLSEIVHNKSKLLKVIIESGELTEAEIIQCCDTFGPLNIDYMKTSTGFAGMGASVNNVQLMRRHLPSHVKIKASGGIRTYEFAKALVDAGADRLGCSASVAIVSGEPGLNHSTY
jgi:deoxyribose-phosphate aldolase